MLFFTPTIIAIGGAVLGVLLLGIVIIKRWKVADVDGAIIITGKGSKVVRNNSGTFVIPFLQKATELSLRARQITVSADAQSLKGTPVSVTAVAQYKVDSTSAESLQAAAERYGNQQDKMDTFLTETLLSSLRSIIGEMEVEALVTDRLNFTERVRAVVEDVLGGQGLKLDSFGIQSIEDGEGYLADFSRPQAAENRRKAEIADTEAKRAADLVRIAADEEVAIRQRALDLKRAEIQVETDTARSRAEAASPIEAATQRQAIVEQERLTALGEVSLREAQLDASVRKEAEAHKYATIQNAEAEAAATRAKAEAERDARIAQAEAIKAEGLAEAEVIAARGEAEAGATKARSDALIDGQALLQQDAIRMLPEVAREMAAPMANIDSLTVVSTDGASQLSKNVASGVAEVSGLLKGSTGIDLASLFTGAVGGVLGSKAIPTAAVAATVPATAPVAEEATPAPKVAPAAKTGAEFNLPDEVLAAFSAAPDKAALIRQYLPEASKAEIKRIIATVEAAL